MIINSHGGNDFKQILRELQPQFPEIFLCVINWFRMPGIDKFFDEPGDHAGEMETSMLMEIAPELVLPLREAGNGREKKFKLKELQEGWIWAQREWTQISQDTGVGNPEKATMEKGKQFLEELKVRIGNFLIQLDCIDNNELYEK